MDTSERTIRDFLYLFICAIRSGEVEIKEQFMDGGEGPYVNAYTATWRDCELKILREKVCTILDGVILDFLEDDTSYHTAVLYCYRQQQEAKQGKLQQEHGREQELAKLRRRRENEAAITRLADKIALLSAPQGM